ncbi:MAG: hypothetical protein NZM35_02785 [Chitinophagales bacterium]|nr:hypothetical protein [Chitinophagales bacterium]MDW8418115.1 hypothetical protein [Chitinophagales bacterium]
MFDSNIEFIHSLEYAFLVLLVFPFVSRFGAAIILTVPFMLIDEWYQYTSLYPAFNTYFEFNDILMDIFGCGLMMSILKIYGVESDKSTPFYRRTEFFVMLGGIALIFVLLYYCVIATYANLVCENTLLVLNERKSPEPMWRLHEIRNVWYHVMKPGEALVVISTALIFYMGLDGFFTVARGNK